MSPVAEKNPGASSPRTTGEKYKLTEDCVDGDVEQRKVEFHVRQEVVLWNPLAMVLFIGLITAEWVIRKFSNLS